MAEPLDYFHPGKREPGPTSNARKQPQAALPVEFDLMLTRTQDHAAARAVEQELARQGIKVFRTEEAGHAGRWVGLHVRASDRERASHIAGMIFARRKKMSGFPRQVVEPQRMPGEPDPDRPAW